MSSGISGSYWNLYRKRFNGQTDISCLSYPSPRASCESRSQVQRATIRTKPSAQCNIRNVRKTTRLAKQDGCKIDGESGLERIELRDKAVAWKLRGKTKPSVAVHGNLIAQIDFWVRFFTMYHNISHSLMTCKKKRECYFLFLAFLLPSV